MLAKEILISLIDYDDWATTRLLELAARLPLEQLLAPAEVNHGSLHALLFHILRTNYLWRSLIHTGKQPPKLSLEMFPDISSLQGFWLKESELLREVAAKMSPLELAQEVKIVDWQGNEQHFIAWQMLVHTLLHGMQHRSEAASLLTKFGYSPGDIDFIYYV